MKRPDGAITVHFVRFEKLAPCHFPAKCQTFVPDVFYVGLPDIILDFSVGMPDQRYDIAANESWRKC